jgi:thymidylate synthase
VYHLNARYSRDLYLPTLQYLIDKGEPVEPRGRKTLELLNFVTEVTEPWHHCILLPSRRWNPWLALSEALWILAGRNDVAALKPYNSNIVNFSDDGNHLYGAYGARIYHQIDPLIERLTSDPNDRRAVLQIWNSIDRDPEYTGDLTVDSKDPPCNNLLYFKLRKKQLHMTVICRSNDIHWGLYAVNLPTFGILQSYIAARLNVEMGSQTHLSNSLHVYTDDQRAVDITERMLYRESEDRPAYPAHALAFRPFEFQGITSHEQFARICNSILDGDNPPSAGTRYPLFLAFASEFLKEYKEKRYPINDTFPEFQDWTLAGQMFANKVWNESIQRI